MANNLDRIRKEVAKGLIKAKMTRPAVLVVVTAGTRTPGALTAGTNPTETSVQCKGLVITWKRALLGATLVAVGDRVVMLLGQTLGTAAPKPGDKITIEGVTSRVIDISRDPAAATYSCLTRL